MNAGQILSKIKGADIGEKEILLAHILKIDKSRLLAHPETPINKKQLADFQRLTKKLSVGFSVAVLIGHKEFFGLDFFVDKNTLIPRPDTEIMVENALDKIAQNKYDTILDIGTGSGCIAISVAKFANKKIRIIGSDISSGALKIAKKNAKRHNVKIKFVKSNLLKNLNPKGKNILILANLPYLTQKQFDSEKSIQKEPRRALVAKNGGLELYEKLLHQIKERTTKQNFTLLIEIDPSQTQHIKKIILKTLPKSKIEIKKDLPGLDRLVIIQNAE